MVSDGTALRLYVQSRLGIEIPLGSQPVGEILDTAGVSFLIFEIPKTVIPPTLGLMPRPATIIQAQSR